MPKLTDSIQYLKGVGEKKAKLYEKLGVDTIYSLLRFFPRTYLDYTAATAIADCSVGDTCCVRAKIFRKHGEQRIRKGLSVFKLFATDGTADLTITIFNSRYQFDALEVGREYCFYGKIQGNFLRKEMNSPSFLDPERENGVRAIYHLTEGLTSRQISAAVHQALAIWGDQLEDVLPSSLKIKEELCHLRFAYENIHFPQNQQALELAKKRFVFEELLTLQLGLLLMKRRNRCRTGLQLHDFNLGDFYQSLPFSLTEDQKQAIDEGIADFAKGFPMNRLVQGDVGSGKTMVACGLTCCMAKNGYQVAVMAPTEILAQQHFHTFSELLEPLGLRCALLVGSLTAAKKNKLRQEIADGAYSVVIGTHALLQDSVSFAKLGLVITDEQHRFGVLQRAKLSQKGENPHKLVMSATPIPRTLALIVYGDLDVSVIRQMPKGRLPVETYFINGKKRQRAYGFIKKHLDEGRQAYIICPLIEEGEESREGMRAVQDYAESLKDTVLVGAAIGVLHGKLKPAEKERMMQQFQCGKINLLVSTTVVEVGVDVPNAVIMMIENAENFGLSQLHQLRGRVGRGSMQSYCILVSDNRNEQTIERLKIMTRSTDGFEIAEQDLKQRGPGDFFGERQHGLPALKIANMVEDMQTLMKTQEIAKQLLEADPQLSLPEHKGLRCLVGQLFAQKTSDN